MLNLATSPGLTVSSAILYEVLLMFPFLFLFRDPYKRRYKTSP